MKLEPEIASRENALAVRWSRMNSFRGVKFESEGVLGILRWMDVKQRQGWLTEMGFNSQRWPGHVYHSRLPG
jgi:hypothetical protein